MAKKKKVAKYSDPWLKSMHDVLSTMDKEELYPIWLEVNEVFQKINRDKNTKRMREASGERVTHSFLVVFLYILMRDEVTPGRIERIMLSISNENDQDAVGEFKMTNGWLTQYAEDIASRLLRNRITKSTTPSDV